MKGYKHATKDQLLEAVRIYAEELCVPATAKRVGISSSQVRAALKRAGLALTGAKGGACYRNRQTVERMAAEGQPFSAIAKAVGSSRHRVADFLRKFQIPFVPFVPALEKNARWKGGRTTNKGYAFLKRRDHPDANRHGYVQEHRLVMEKELGRRLTKREVVHHKDETQKANNAPENLKLYASNGEHLRESLKGKRPNWTAAGRARTMEGLRRWRAERRSANLVKSKSDGER